MPKKKLITVILATLIIFSACGATLNIKTWIIKEGVLTHAKETLEPQAAPSFRCYSEADDMLWRTDYAIQKDCCAGRGK